MIKYDSNIDAYYYYEDDKHILTNDVSNDMASTIISNLILSQDFQCDQTISHRLYTRHQARTSFAQCRAVLA